MKCAFSAENATYEKAQTCAMITKQAAGENKFLENFFN
jgi:hypothetical protein